jgi:hypothetical protein
MSSPVPGFPPRWLQVGVNVGLAVTLLGGYLVLFGWGTYRAWRGIGESTWPVDNEDLHTVLSGIGGLLATIFAVALNLPVNDTMGRRSARVLSIILPPKPDITGQARWDWDKLENQVLTVVGVAMVLAYLMLVPLGFFATLFHADHTPDFIEKFSGPGMGVLVTAVTLWVGRLARST